MTTCRRTDGVHDLLRRPGFAFTDRYDERAAELRAD